MSFVKGQTTWANLVPTIVGLATGELSDDSGKTVDPADRWRRVGVQADNALRLPAVHDIPVTEAGMRSGYFTGISNALAWTGGLTPGYIGVEGTSFARVKTCYTSLPVAGLNRWMVNLVCTKANTAAGNYADSVWRYRIINPETGGENSTPLPAVSPAADGTLTLGAGLTVQVGDPSGVLKKFSGFMRLFTGAAAGGFVGGIDWWPNYHRAVATATFGTAPSGTATTDYEIISLFGSNAHLPLDTSNWDTSATWPGKVRYGWGLGLGIKTNAGLTGNRYTVNFAMNRSTFRLIAGSGASNGIVFLQHGEIGTDSVTGTRRYGVQSIGDTNEWLKPFNTAGAVDPNAPVQYWLRVTDNALVVCLNADPGFSGTSTQNWIVKLNEYPSQLHPSFNVMWGKLGVQEEAWVAQDQTSTDWQQTGVREGGRDYQTGWMRYDGGASGSSSSVDWIGGVTSTTNAEYNRLYDNVTPLANFEGAARETLQAVGINGYSSSALNESALPGREAHPNPVTGEWGLYVWGYVDDYMALSNELLPGDQIAYRGYIDCGAFYLPGNSWTSGDTLEDPAPGGETFFLFAASIYGCGPSGGTRSNGGTGGLAILID